MNQQEPYYAVIFSSSLSEDTSGYAEMAERMNALAAQQKGFLGVDSVRDGREGITVSYWTSLEAIVSWKAHTDHQLAQRLGREQWYRSYSLRICKVEREYSFDRHRDQPP